MSVLDPLAPLGYPPGVGAALIRERLDDLREHEDALPLERELLRLHERALVAGGETVALLVAAAVLDVLDRAASAGALQGEWPGA